ncbi:hypothetical protein T492DRAFT_908985 [Pavlovales sp. CCMP2436]|nr:hypothetical protein T492DRAFT_908985 [Pavlovales sp. CCMP2436]
MLLSVPGFGLGTVGTSAGPSWAAGASLSPSRAVSADDSQQVAHAASAHPHAAARSAFSSRSHAPHAADVADERERQESSVRTQRDLLTAYARRSEFQFLGSRADAKCLCAEVRTLEGQLATTGAALILAAGERKKLRDEVHRLGEALDAAAQPQPRAVAAAARATRVTPRAPGAPAGPRELELLRGDNTALTAARAELAEALRCATDEADARNSELSAARLEALQHRAELATVQANAAVSTAAYGSVLARAERALATALKRAVDDRCAATLAEAARERTTREAREAVAGALSERDAEVAASRARKRASSKELRDETSARKLGDERALAAEARCAQALSELELARRAVSNRTRAAQDAQAALGAVVATSQDAEATLSARLCEADNGMRRAEATAQQAVADKAVLAEALRALGEALAEARAEREVDGAAAAERQHLAVEQLRGDGTRVRAALAEVAAEAARRSELEGVHAHLGARVRAIESALADAVSERRVALARAQAAEAAVVVVADMKAVAEEQREALEGARAERDGAVRAAADARAQAQAAEHARVEFEIHGTASARAQQASAEKAALQSKLQADKLPALAATCEELRSQLGASRATLDVASAELAAAKGQLAASVRERASAEAQHRMQHGMLANVTTELRAQGSLAAAAAQSGLIGAHVLAAELAEVEADAVQRHIANATALRAEGAVRHERAGASPPSAAQAALAPALTPRLTVSASADAAAARFGVERAAAERAVAERAAAARAAATERKSTWSAESTRHADLELLMRNSGSADRGASFTPRQPGTSSSAADTAFREAMYRLANA